MFGWSFLLEMVAQMLYFAYIMMLHLYETSGFWQKLTDVKRIHFATEWNKCERWKVVTESLTQLCV